MKEFGELKGYQGDIKGKALVDYIKWVMPMKEKIWDVSGNFWSHDAGMITHYLSNKVNKEVDTAENTFKPFWEAYHKLLETLIEDLELTNREKKLWEVIWQYKEYHDEDYTWKKYVIEFKKFHEILNELNNEDNKFIKFWVDGYE